LCKYDVEKRRETAIVSFMKKLFFVFSLVVAATVAQAGEKACPKSKAACPASKTSADKSKSACCEKSKAACSSGVSKKALLSPKATETKS
jgi:hypothetical protein